VKKVAADDQLATKPSALSLMRVVRAFGYSANGVKYAWQEEAAFRQELFLAVIFVPLGLLLGEGAVEKVLLVGACLLVLVVELLNTGIEAVVDRIGLEKHELSGVAKDLGSAAVLLSLFMWAFTWGLLVLPQMW